MDQEYQSHGGQGEYDEDMHDPQHEGQDEGDDGEEYGQQGEEEEGGEYGEEEGDEQPEGEYGEEEGNEDPHGQGEQGHAPEQGHMLDHTQMPHETGMPHQGGMQHQGMPDEGHMPGQGGMQHQGMPGEGHMQSQGVMPQHGGAPPLSSLPQEIQPLVEQLLHTFMDLLHQKQQIPKSQHQGSNMHPDMQQTYTQLYQGLQHLQQLLHNVDLQHALQEIEGQMHGEPGQAGEEEEDDQSQLHPQMQQILQEMQQHAPPVDHNQMASADPQDHQPVAPRPNAVDPSQMWQALTAGGP